MQHLDMRFSSMLGLAAPIVLFAACTSPLAGGQTGDPGVGDFISLDPQLPPVEIEGSQCRTAGPALSREPSLRILDSQHVVMFDPARGVSVADVSGATPALVGQLAMEQAVGDLHVVGSRALLVRRAFRGWGSYFDPTYPPLDDAAELASIDLSDPAHPVPGESIALEQPARSSYVVASGDRTYVYVLSDDGAADGCIESGPLQRQLTAFERQGESFVRGSVLALEEDTQVVALGDKLALLRARAEVSELSLVTFGPAPGASVEGAAVRLSGAADAKALWRSEALLRVTSVLRGDAYIEEFDIHDDRALTLRRGCKAAVVFGYAGTSGSVVSASERIFFQANGTNLLTSTVLKPDGTCDVEWVSSSQRTRRLLPVGAGKLLQVEQEGGSIVVSMIAQHDLALVARAELPALAKSIFDVNIAANEGQQTSLLGVSFLSDEPGYARAVALFRFDESGIEALGRLDAGKLLPLAGPRPLVLSNAGLSVVELMDPRTPKAGAALDLQPNFTRLWSVGEHWVRLRAPERVDPEAYYPTGLTQQALTAADPAAQLQVVAGSDLPDTATPLSSLAVSPWARFAQVDDLLVALSADPKDAQGRGRLEIFDPTHGVQRVAELEVTLLALPDNNTRWYGAYRGESGRGAYCLDCPDNDLQTRSLALPHALVLVEAAGLRVLDLRNPQRPVLSDPLALPGVRELRSVVAVEATVYYAYTDAVDASDDDVPKVRFYVGSVDLRNPAKPSFGKAHNVRGQLVAAARDGFYTRELRAADDGLECLLHRWSLSATGLELSASHSFGGRMALAIEETADGTVLADLTESPTPPYWDHAPVTELHVLSAEDLAPQGDAVVGPFGRRIARTDGNILYSAAEGYVQMVVSRDGLPERRGYWPSLAPGATPRAVIRAGVVVVQDRGSLHRVVP